MPLRAPPVDYDALRRTVLGAVRQATGLDANHVIVAEPERPNWPRPSLPYVTYKVTSPSIRYGIDWLEASDQDPYDQVLCGPRGVAVSLNSYGQTHEQAYAVLALVQAGFDDPAVTMSLSLGGVAVWSVGQMTDLSLLLTTGYEGRAQMDVTLGVASRLPLTVGTIEHASIVGNVHKEDDTVVQVNEEL